MDCIFCKIANKEIPADIYFEDDLVMVIKNIEPEAAFHALAIPKRHIELSTSVSHEQDVLGHLLFVAKEVGKQQLADGFRLIINNGKDSGQEIAHLHVHTLGGQPLGNNLCLK